MPDPQDGPDLVEFSLVHVFISYSTKDREFIVTELAPLLESHGLEAWYGEDEIKTADLWERSIFEGLRDSEWFVVVMSPRSAQSVWVQREVNWAMQNRAGRIVPVLLEPCNPLDFHLEMPQIQLVKFTAGEDLEKARYQLLSLWGLKSKEMVGSVEPWKVASIVRQFTSSDKNAQSHAESQFVNLGEKAIPSLVRLLGWDHEISVRCRAAETLGRIGPRAREALPALVQVLEDGPPTGWEPKEYLQRSQRGDPQWIQMREAGERLMRSTAAALGDIGPLAGEALPYILDVALWVPHGLESRDGYRRTLERSWFFGGVIRSIGPDSKTISELIDLLDGEPHHQIIASQILGELGHSAREALPVLRKLAKATRPYFWRTEKATRVARCAEIAAKEIAAEMISHPEE